MDRSFVSTILTDPRSRIIVDSTNQMAHALGLRMVAEGVEDDDIATERPDWGSTCCRATTSRGRCRRTEVVRVGPRLGPRTGQACTT